MVGVVGEPTRLDEQRRQQVEFPILGFVRIYDFCQVGGGLRKPAGLRHQFPLVCPLEPSEFGALNGDVEELLGPVSQRHIEDAVRHGVAVRQSERAFWFEVIPVRVPQLDGVRQGIVVQQRVSVMGRQARRRGFDRGAHH